MAGAGASGGESLSLFELPVSRGARVARIAAVVALNAVLAGSGIAMIASYFRDRAAVLERFKDEPETSVEPAAAAVDVSSPVPNPTEPRGASPAPGQVVAKGATAGKPGRVAGAGKPTRAARTPEAPRKRAGDKAARPGPAAQPPPSGAPAPAEPAETTKETVDETLGTDPRDHEVADEAPAPEPDMQRISALVGREVDRHRVQLQKCYQQAAKTAAPGTPLSGRLEVRFTIMPNGTASDVSVPVNTSGSDRLADCVSTSLAGWALPAPGDEPVVLQWPFVFTAPR